MLMEMTMGRRPMTMFDHENGHRKLMSQGHESARVLEVDNSNVSHGQSVTFSLPV